MHPTRYRPPSSAEAPYAAPNQPALAPQDYRYTSQRDQSRHPAPLITIQADADAEEFKGCLLREYRLKKTKTNHQQNPNEYFNIEYYQ